MKDNFVSVVVWITAATDAGFASWLDGKPSALVTAFGIETSTPAMLAAS